MIVYRLSLLAALIALSAAATVAQRKPSEATRPFVVKSAQSLDDLQKSLKPDNKVSELIDSEGMQLRVAVQHEKGRAGAAAELHDASDDVYYVLDGTATLVLGGKLDAPKETDPGEWRVEVSGHRNTRHRRRFIRDAALVPAPGHNSAGHEPGDRRRAVRKLWRCGQGPRPADHEPSVTEISIDRAAREASLGR